MTNQDWPGEDLEAAYLRALEANEAAEWEFAHLPESEEDETSDTATASGVPDAGVLSADESDAEPAEPDETPSRITIRQVIEAALFVGGEPLTSKKLCYMLHGDYDLDAIDDAIDELNHLYLDEGRPYEIRLGEGGYRLVLRQDFERIRNRVYGVGPREVKLSQDVLEVLALVAYRQPITPEEIEDLGKSNPGPMLRQLLRRELISLERDSEDRKRVTYATTKRFLSVFGIGSIEELPQADELAFK
jgi:segregation and condensation protein B